MPRKQTVKRARRDAAQGKSASTQAGEFVHDEIDRVREGEHGARSAKQAIAIGLSEARRAGVKIPPRPGSKKKTNRKTSKKKSARRSRAAVQALKREPRSTVSRASLSRQAKSSAAKRGSKKRKAAARKAAATRKHR